MVPPCFAARAARIRHCSTERTESGKASSCAVLRMRMSAAGRLNSAITDAPRAVLRLAVHAAGSQVTSTDSRRGKLAPDGFPSLPAGLRVLFLVEANIPHQYTLPGNVVSSWLRTHA